MSPESSADNLPELFDNGADAEVQLSRSSSAVFRPCLFGEDMLLNEEELSDFPEASCYKNKTGKLVHAWSKLSPCRSDLTEICLHPVLTQGLEPILLYPHQWLVCC